MAEVLQGGTLAVNAMLFGVPDGNLQAHLSQQFNRGLNNLTDMGQRLFQESKQLFERFSGDSALRFIRGIARANTAMWQTDMIRYINSIGEMQYAAPIMQRWIMAEPSVRRAYHEQRIDGYSHYYVDMQPGVVGRHHYDYRRATNGLMMFYDGDDPTIPEWSATEYLDELYEGDRELSIVEKDDIQHTWECVRTMLKDGRDDPTSRFNASLE